jgi:putative sigma-54 modulation protein
MEKGALDMQVSVTFRNMESKEVLREYVQEKISKLKKYFDYPLEANVVLSVEKHRHIAEVTLVANRLTINAQEETEDMFSAIDRVLDKLERQVLKHKEKIKRHKISSPAPESLPPMEDSESMSSEEGPEPKLIKSKRVRAQLMSVEEAAMQMDILENDFLVFTNANSKTLNIIYRLKDGHYGIMEPQVD